MAVLNIEERIREQTDAVDLLLHSCCWPSAFELASDKPSDHFLQVLFASDSKAALDANDNVTLQVMTIRRKPKPRFQTFYEENLFTTNVSDMLADPKALAVHKAGTCDLSSHNAGAEGFIDSTFNDILQDPMPPTASKFGVPSLFQATFGGFSSAFMRFTRSEQEAKLSFGTN